MDTIIRFSFVFLAGISVINLLVAERRVRSSTTHALPDQTALARRVARTYYGSNAAFFLLLGVTQWAGGYSNPFFPFYDRTTTVWSTVAWALFGVLWTTHIVGLWRPGVAEVGLQFGLFRGRNGSPRLFRLMATVGLLVSAIVFAALLAGFWGPVPRPKL